MAGFSRLASAQWRTGWQRIAGAAHPGSVTGNIPGVPMQKLAASLLAVLLAAGPAIAAEDGATKKRRADARQVNPGPSAVAERQKHKRTFDETQYYERLSEKIPFGSDAWWRQKQIEDANE